MGGARPSQRAGEGQQVPGCEPGRRISYCGVTGVAGADVGVQMVNPWTGDGGQPVFILWGHSGVRMTVGPREWCAPSRRMRVPWPSSPPALAWIVVAVALLRNIVIIVAVAFCVLLVTFKVLTLIPLNQNGFLILSTGNRFCHGKVELFF